MLTFSVIVGLLVLIGLLVWSVSHSPIISGCFFGGFEVLGQLLVALVKIVADLFSSNK